MIASGYGESEDEDLHVKVSCLRLQCPSSCQAHIPSWMAFTIDVHVRSSILSVMSSQDGVPASGAAEVHGIFLHWRLYQDKITSVSCNLDIFAMHSP